MKNQEVLPLISENIVQKLLIAPAREGADELHILAGYATPNMATWLITNLHEKKLPPISIRLIIGMTSYDGLSLSYHEEFKALHGKQFGSGLSSFQCSYSYEKAIHSNLYVWLKGNTPYKAFVSSANFTQSAFLSGRWELAEASEPLEANYYFNDADKHSIFCNHSEVEEYITFHKKSYSVDDDGKLTSLLTGEGIDHVTLSLLSRSGEPGKRSGLNWGQRSKRNLNQAYIPLSRDIASKGFFPLNKQHFTARTDDGHTLVLRVEQQGNKAITTPLCNADIGEYFRNRLGLPNGAYIDKRSLENYGRTDVTFYKIDDEEFYMDFSV